MIEHMIRNPDNTLFEVMETINENSLGVCFIVEDNGLLLGILTDGDIRRALLNNNNLNTPSAEVINKDFIFGYVKDSRSELLDKFNNDPNKVINIIPIVDNNFKLVDYFKYPKGDQFPMALPNLKGNEFKYLADAFLSTWISSTGKYIDKFEDSFSSYSDCNYGIAVSNGTASLHVSLLALGIGEGDEVIIPDLTFASTINAVLHANATPVIVDVEEKSWCINPKEIRKAITEKTKAVIPVHLYGQVCDMEAIMNLAEEFNLAIIEDCAEAHGATYKGKKVGSFGDVGSFSFYGNKIITTGEGGMCTTNSKQLNDKMKLLRDHGMSKTRRYYHEIVGFNYRLTNLQAAIGLAQLERIELIHNNRSIYEKFYRRVFRDARLKFQRDLPNRKRVTWLVSMLAKSEKERDRLIGLLKENTIEARPFFYLLSEMEIYKKYLRSPSINASKISRCGISLPTYESLKSIGELEVIFKKFKGIEDG